MEHPVRHSGSREPCRIPYGHTGSRIVTQDPVSSFRVSYRRTGSRIVTQDPAWSSRIPYGHAGSRTVIQDPGRSCRIRYGHKGIRHGHKGSGKILPDPLCHTGFLDMGAEVFSVNVEFVERFSGRKGRTVKRLTRQDSFHSV